MSDKMEITLLAPTSSGVKKLIGNFFAEVWHCYIGDYVRFPNTEGLFKITYRDTNQVVAILQEGQ